MFKSVDTFPRTQNYVNGILVNIDKIANILMDNIQPVMTPDGTNMFAQGEEKYQFVTQRYYYFPEQCSNIA